MKYVCTVIAALLLFAAPTLRAQAVPPDQENPPVGMQNHNPDGGGRSWHGHGEGWDRGRHEGWDRGRHEERDWRDQDNWRGRERHRVRVRFGLFGWRWVWYWGLADWGSHSGHDWNYEQRGDHGRGGH
jgi:hypothetical protein